MLSKHCTFHLGASQILSSEPYRFDRIDVFWFLLGFQILPDRLRAFSLEKQVSVLRSVCEECDLSFYTIFHFK